MNSTHFNGTRRQRQLASGALKVTGSILVLWAALWQNAAAAVDESKLPPAATNRIDFARDIKPILDGTCLKCHGAEKPKGRFRVDNREALLRGGESGAAVFPGQSGKSPLIHFVAGLVEDMEMPPKGKGETLTAQQVSLLRAWIDQGLPWTGVEAAASTVVEVSPTVRWVTLDGNERKFREHEWFREGWNGGLEKFLVQQQLSLDQRATVEGHALRDDYKVKLSWKKTDALFVRAGFEQFRKYYDDSGGYYELFTPSWNSLRRDLHLDLGKAWVEAGGLTPFGLQLTGGYEYHFKEGEKSTTQWRPTGPGGSERTILPSSKDIDERLHVLRLDAAYEWEGIRLEDNFRYEFYDLATERRSVRARAPSVDFTQRIRETDDSQNLANAFRVETQPREWLLLSAGYLFTKTDGEAGFRQRPTDAAGLPRDGLLWTGRGITLEQSSHVFNANAQFGLWEDMTLAAGVQPEWNRQRTFGNVNLDEHEFGDITLTNPNPAVLRGDYDRFTVEEQLTLRNTQIPFTVLFGEVRLKQETIDQFESQEENGLAEAAFVRDTAATYNWRQYRLGFNTSPWTRIALNAYVQRRDREDEFDHDIDLPGNGYPGFIRERETETDELGARLVLRPASWLKTTLAYRWVETEYETVTDPAVFDTGTTPGGRIDGGEYRAHVYSLNATLTPWRRLYFFSTFAFHDSRTETEDNGSPAIVPYRGHVYSAMTTANYVLNQNTDLKLTYDFSYANYGQNNEAGGLPLGIDYRRHGIRAGFGRHFWKRFLANLEYGWFRYEEPSSGEFNNYTAHGVFATLHVRWN